jgi:DNA-binding winged helix-turn-helix (wHTH) protein/tetratricopeptide (TPR) repeat protein
MAIENLEKSEVYQFDDCELDADRRELRIAGEPVTMQPKAFELLLHLVRNRHRAVDKHELQDALWPRSIVTETALTRCVMKARRAVNDDADKQSVIKTVHGHGYRFIADIREPAVAEATPVEAAPQEPVGPASQRRSHKLLATSVAAIIGLVVVWWFLAPPAVSGNVRLAVLPVENATGDDDLDWTRMGLMALMNRMLEDQGVTVVSGNSVSRLAGDAPLKMLMRRDSEFRAALKETTAATHMVGATLENEGGLYRLTYVIEGGEQTERRTVVGQEPAALIRDVISTLTTLATKGAPDLERMSFVSSDDFLNEAYARAMALQFEGRFEESRRLFQVIIEQEPELFWPRYEYALATRNLREFDAAERQFIALRDEAAENGELKHVAAASNSLGVMYMGQRRNDEALAAFESVVEIASKTQDTHYLATAHINLGLLAKNQGDLPVAYEHMMTAKQIYLDADIKSLPGTLENNISGILILQGKLDEAEQHSLAAIENFRLTGSRLYESYALSRLSSIYRRNGLLDDAEDAAMRAKVVREELGDRRGTAASLLTLSDIAFDRGDLTRAHQYALQAGDIAIEIDDQDLRVEALATMAKAELALGQPGEAAANYTAAEALASSHDDRMNAFGARYGLARSWIAMGDYDGARSIAEQIIAETAEHDRRREETAGHNLVAEIYMQQGRYEEAIAALEEVLAIALEIGDSGLAASAHGGLGRCWLELGDTEKAATHIGIVVAERPADAELLRLQARLAAISGKPREAARLMADARIRAGERWTADDDQQLASYQAAASASDVGN